MKIIDYDKKGNVVRFYLGDDDCEDYWGDDWDDAPYDCNAGSVYDRYITGRKDLSFRFDDSVLEPCDGEYNCNFTKEDMKKRRVPCIVVAPKEITDNFWSVGFKDVIGADGIIKFYFGDHMEPDENS